MDNNDTLLVLSMMAVNEKKRKIQISINHVLNNYTATHCLGLGSESKRVKQFLFTFFFHSLEMCVACRQH